MNNNVPYYRLYRGIFEMIDHPQNLVLMTEMGHEIRPHEHRGFEGWHKTYEKGAIAKYWSFMRVLFKFFPLHNAVIVGLDSQMRDYCYRSIYQVGGLLRDMRVPNVEKDLLRSSGFPIEKKISHRIMSLVNQINSLARGDTTVIVVADPDNVEDASGYRPEARLYEARIDGVKISLSKGGEIEFEKPI